MLIFTNWILKIDFDQVSPKITGEPHGEEEYNNNPREINELCRTFHSPINTM